MPRSIWNGTVAFGMVRVPVKLYAATESKAVHFHERHERDGAAVQHRRVCVKENREVPYGEIVKGFEAKSGSYVVLSKEEIAAADGTGARVIEIEHFVSSEEIDPLYYDHAYYLGPGNDAGEPYRVLHAALRRSGRVGIARFVFHNRAHLVAVRALGDVLAVHTMRFADELVSASELELPRPQTTPSRRELDMANALVEQLAARFQPGRYRDTYREALMSLIERKAKGETIEAPVEEPATAEDDLVRALQESLAATGARGSRARGARARAKAGSSR
jgi:DNA end-binding protein Ku